ncbi:MAG: YfhO family protein [Chloroflexi bacterium]|nr:YfhO family protein [Chloroflexota bacterium]
MRLALGVLPRRLGPWREFLIVAVAFLAILGALFWRVILRQELLVPADILYFLDPVWRGLAPSGFTSPDNTLLSDQVFQFYPWRVFSTESLRQGIVPLWNPFVLGGTPFLANMQAAVFYPLNLLLLVLPMPVGVGYLAIIRLLIAASSTYYYLRTIGVGRCGSFVGGCAFALGGFSVVWLGSPMSNVAVLLPLALLLVELLLRKPGGLRFACLALVIGAQFLGGHPETSFHLGLVLTGYVIFRLVAGWRTGELRGRVGRLGTHIVAAALVGAAVGAVQTLPFLAILTETSTFAFRQSMYGENWLFYTEFLNDAVGLITMLFPNAFGNPSIPGGASLNPFSNYSEQAAYIGTVPLILAVLGAAIWRRNRYVGFWLATAIVSGGVAFRLPLFEVVNHLPLLNLTANSRLRLALILGLAILSAFGVDVLIKKAPDIAFLRAFGRWLGVSALVGLGAVLSVFVVLLLFREPLLRFATGFAAATIPGRTGFVEPLIHYLQKLPEMYESLIRFYNPLSPRVIVPVYVAALFWLALWPLSSKRLGGAWLKGSVLLLTVAELSWLAYPYNPSLPAKQAYAETEAITFLKGRADAGRIAGVGFALTPNSSMLWRLQDVRGYEMTVDRRFHTFYSSFATGLPFGAYNLLADADARLLDLLGVKYVLAQSGTVKAGPELARVFDVGGVEIFENREALPRAFLVGKARHIADDGQVLAAMQSPDFKPREEVLLDNWAPAHAARAASGRAEVTDVSPNEVEVKVLADAPSWLVLSDTYDGSWKAYVDGEKADIYRANYVMRAVRVGAAEHRVRFVYDPPAYSLGLRITLAALALLAVIILYTLLGKLIPALSPRLAGKRYW